MIIITNFSFTIKKTLFITSTLNFFFFKINSKLDYVDLIMILLFFDIWIYFDFINLKAILLI
jgi:hypothetical protein